MRGLGVGFGWKSSQGFVFGNEDMMKNMEKCYLQNYGLGKSGIELNYTWET